MFINLEQRPVSGRDRPGNITDVSESSLEICLMTQVDCICIKVFNRTWQLLISCAYQIFKSNFPNNQLVLDALKFAWPSFFAWTQYKVNHSFSRKITLIYILPSGSRRKRRLYDHLYCLNCLHVIVLEPLVCANWTDYKHLTAERTVS